MWATKPVLRLRFLFVISCMYSIRIQRFTLKIIYYFLKFYLHIKNMNVNLKTLASNHSCEFESKTIALKNYFQANRHCTESENY